MQDVMISVLGDGDMLPTLPMRLFKDVYTIARGGASA